jgi:hypothetical protein
MTPKAYREALTRLGLSQRGAAVFLDINERTSRAYALGGMKIPRKVQIALHLMVKHQEVPADVLKEIAA